MNRDVGVFKSEQFVCIINNLEVEATIVTEGEKVYIDDMQVYGVGGVVVQHGINDKEVLREYELSKAFSYGYDEEQL